MEAFLAKDPSLKETAQRAFVSYAKAVFLMKNKKIFNVQSLNTEAFSKSLGLAIPPRIRFLQRMNARLANKNPQQTSKIVFKDSDDEDNENNEVESKLHENTESFHVPNDSDSDDGILKVKRQNHDIDLPSENELELNDGVKNQKKKKVLTKAAVAKKLLKKRIKPNKKIIFDDEGVAVTQGTKEKRSELAQQYENEQEGGIDIVKAREVLKEEDKFDKQLFKEKVKAKHKEEKRKLKEKKKKQQEEDEVDEFGSNSEDEPDLSWLPDPDVIYGKNDGDDDGHEKENDADNDDRKKEPVHATNTQKEL